jgi:hypothetical protein
MPGGQVRDHHRPALEHLAEPSSANRRLHASPSTGAFPGRSALIGTLQQGGARLGTCVGRGLPRTCIFHIERAAGRLIHGQARATPLDHALNIPGG